MKQFVMFPKWIRRRLCHACCIQNSGVVLWQVVIGSPVFSSPAPFYGGYIVASVNRYIYAFSHSGQKVTALLVPITGLTACWTISEHNFLMFVLLTQIAMSGHLVANTRFFHGLCLAVSVRGWFSMYVNSLAALAALDKLYSPRRCGCCGAVNKTLLGFVFFCCWYGLCSTDLTATSEVSRSPVTDEQILHKIHNYTVQYIQCRD